MPSGYQIETTDGITAIRFSAPPGVAEFRSAIDEIAAGDFADLRLWDLSCGGNMGTDQIRQLAEYSLDHSSRRPTRVAFIAPQDLSFGQARMFEVFREEELTAIAVFRTEADALRWLKDE